MLLFFFQDSLTPLFDWDVKMKTETKRRCAPWAEKKAKGEQKTQQWL